MLFSDVVLLDHTFLYHYLVFPITPRGTPEYAVHIDRPHESYDHITQLWSVAGILKTTKD